MHSIYYLDTIDIFSLRSYRRLFTVLVLKSSISLMYKLLARSYRSSSTKMKILSSLTHPCVVPNPYNLIFFNGTQKEIVLVVQTDCTVFYVA